MKLLLRIIQSPQGFVITLCISVLLLFGVVSGCLPDSHPGSSYQQNRQKRLAMETQNDLKIVKVGKCQYVLWYNGYGSDMEHYGACEHCANLREKD